MFDSSNGHYKLGNNCVILNHQPFRLPNKYEKGTALLNNALSAESI